MNRKRWLQLVVGCVLSAFFLWIALKDVEFGRLGRVLLTVNWFWLLANFIVFYIGMYWRAFRWARLFQPAYQIPARRAWPPLMICFAANSVLPGRAGEFARAYIIGKQENVSFATAFATVVVERLLDGMILLLLLAAAMGIMPPLDTSLQLTYGPNLLSGRVAFALHLVVAAVWLLGSIWFLLRVRKESALAKPEAHKEGFWVWAGSGRPRAIFMILSSASALAAAVVVLMWAFWQPPVALDEPYTLFSKYTLDGQSLYRLSRKLSVTVAILFVGIALLMIRKLRETIQRVIESFPLLPHALKQFISKMIRLFSSGLESLQSPKRLAILFGDTLAIWFTAAWATQFLSFAFPGLAMTFSQSLSTIVIICIFILIPAAPGYWGLFELGVVFSLKVMGVTQDQTEAVGFALTLHIIQYIPVVVIGFYYLFRLGLSLGEVGGSAEGNRQSATGIRQNKP